MPIGALSPEDLVDAKPHVGALSPDELADAKPAAPSIGEVFARRAIDPFGVGGDVAAGAARGGTQALRGLEIAGGGAAKLLYPFGLGDKAQAGAFEMADALKRKEEELPQPTDTGSKIAQGVGAFIPGILTAGTGAAGAAGQDAIDRGASLPNAEAHAGLGGAESLAALLTGKLGSGVLSRALLQSTAGGVTQEAGRRASNALSPDDQQQAFDPVALGLAVGGGAAGAALPHEAPTAPSVEGLKASETTSAANPPPSPAANLKAMADDIGQKLHEAVQSPPAPNPVIPAAPPVQGGRAATHTSAEYAQEGRTHDHYAKQAEAARLAGNKTAYDAFVKERDASSARLGELEKEAPNAPVRDAAPTVRAGNPVADRSANGTGVDTAPSPVEAPAAAPVAPRVAEGEVPAAEAQKLIQGKDDGKVLDMRRDAQPTKGKILPQVPLRVHEGMAENTSAGRGAGEERQSANGVPPLGRNGDSAEAAMQDLRRQQQSNSSSGLQSSEAGGMAMSPMSPEGTRIGAVRRAANGNAEVERNSTSSRDAAISPEVSENPSGLALDLQRMNELRTARDAGTITPEQHAELNQHLETALNTAEVGGEHIPGLLNQVGRAQLEQSGKMKPFRAKTDIDDFKDINDTLGHDVGDEVLRAKGQAMVDVFGHGNAWREGGDEFGAHAATAEELHAGMEQVRQRLADLVVEGVDQQGKPVAELPVGVSYGVGEGANPKAAAKAADNALYVDKATRTAAGQRTGRRSTDAPQVGERVGTGSPPEGRGEVPRSEQAQVAVAEPPTKAQPAPVKAPPEKPAETVAPEQRDTSVRNAATAVDRATMGLDDLPEAARKGWDKSKAEAADAIAKDPDYARNVARDVLQTKRPLTDSETMALGADRERLHEAYKSNDADILKAMQSGDHEAEVKARIRKESIAEDLDMNHRATQAGGTELARAMAARNAQIKEDYSAPRTQTRARVAYGAKFDAAVEAKVKAITDKIAASDKAVHEAETADLKTAQDKNAKEQAKLQKQIDEMESKLAKRLKVCPL
jgi:diguanylate cyclase (GGDEF)-like protein